MSAPQRGPRRLEQHAPLLLFSVGGDPTCGGEGEAGACPGREHTPQLAPFNGPVIRGRSFRARVAALASTPPCPGTPQNAGGVAGLGVRAVTGRSSCYAR